MAALPYLEQVEYRWIEGEGGCWIWQRGTDGRGYGVVRQGDKRLRAHRVVYEQTRGALPEYLHLHHECGVKLCVNPDHLRPLTVSEHSALSGPINRTRRVSDKQLFYLRQLLDRPHRTSELRKSDVRAQNALQVSFDNGWVSHDGGQGRLGRLWALTDAGREATLNALERRHG